VQTPWKATATLRSGIVARGRPRCFAYRARATRLILYRVMRMRLKAHGHTANPKTALERLRRLQHHRASIGEKAYSGLGKTTQDQHELFEALRLKAPSKTTL
jgi:hypothetical protein